MIKIELTTEEIKHVDNFLEFIETHKMHFGHNKFIEYNKASGCDDIYTLVNHKAFVVTMKSEVKAKDGEIFSVTEKATVIYDLGGYANWKLYNDDRIRFLKENPSIVRKSINISKWSAIASFVIGSVGAVFIILNYIKTIDVKKEEETRLILLEIQYKALQEEFYLLSHKISNLEKATLLFSKSSQDTTLPEKGKK